MKKFLLSLGLVAALASPAAAGRLDDADPSVRQEYNTAVQSADVDATTTASIVTSASDRQSDPQRGDQGAFFGANGR